MIFFLILQNKSLKIGPYGLDMFLWYILPLGIITPIIILPGKLLRRKITMH